jgi:hypothetical protein
MAWVFLGSIFFYSSIYGMMSVISNQFNISMFIILNIIGLPISIISSSLRSIFNSRYLSDQNNNLSSKKIFSIIAFNNVFKIMLFPLVLANIMIESYMLYYWFGLSLVAYELFNIIGLKFVSKKKISDILLVETFPMLVYALILLFVL